MHDRLVIPVAVTVLAGALFTLLGGCAARNYRRDADQEVYRIIDERWQAEFGSKANYIISDIAEPNAPTQPYPSVFAVDTAARRLTLVQAVQLATVRNRDYQTQKESLYLQALDLTLARHDFAPQLFGLLNSGYGKSAGAESIGADAALGFDQLLADGAVISVQIASEWLRFLTGDPSASLGSVLSAAVTQPLLRGAGRKIAQENLTQAERDTLYQLRSFARFRKTFVVSVVTSYYRVLQARDSVANSRNNYDKLLQAEQRLDMLASAGRLPRFEVQQAQQDTLEAWDDFVQTREIYEQQFDDFKIVLGLSPDAEVELDPDELLALETMGVADPNFNVADSIEIALGHRLDLLTARDQVDDAARKVVVAEDALRADLNLVGTIGVPSEEHTRFARLRFDRSDYTLGLEADLPFDRKSERNSYRQALIQLIRQQRAFDLAADEVKLGVRDAYRSFTQAAVRYRIQQTSLKLAQGRVESTDLLIQAGRAITRDLLESQAALLRAQNARTDALVSYVVASLNFARDIGALYVRPDGTWENHGLNPPPPHTATQ